MQAREPVVFPIIGFYDKQRYKQFNPADCANWYLVESMFGKKSIAMYPTMGRRHINNLGINQLVFPVEPRGIFHSINYSYIVSGDVIYRIDSFFNAVPISQGKVVTLGGDIFFDYLVTPSETFVGFVDGINIYIYREINGSFDIQSGIGVPSKPKYIAAFGNRFVVSQENSSQFNLSEINMNGNSYDPTSSFSISGNAVFAQEAGIIRQFGVLHNTLSIFTDFTTGIWSNTPSNLQSTGGVITRFPWSKNTTYDWDFGIQDARSLSVCFGQMTWLAKNSEGLIQVMSSSGDRPERISTRAIDILFTRQSRLGIVGNLSPFVSGRVDGFLYQWENTIFYRLSAGVYTGTGLLDQQNGAASIEFNFESKTWHRVIEKNGERCRIQKHAFYNNTHLVTVFGEGTVYEMSGQFYDNEVMNPAQPDRQAADAYIREPFRYEFVTRNIFLDDYAEFNTEWVQIDFVWGENFNLFSDAPFQDAEFLIAENPGANGEPVYIIDETLSNGEPVYLLGEKGDLPQIDELTYNRLFKPHIELYFSDDGGISFLPADVFEFSRLGVYSWRMRWYQLGASRNRVYMLVGVSPSPLVVLGGVMLMGRISGGAS